MANLAAIWIDDTQDKIEIRLDWDNGRHQVIRIRGYSPDALIAAFEQAAHMLRQEKLAEFI